MSNIREVPRYPFLRFGLALSSFLAWVLALLAFFRLCLSMAPDIRSMLSTFLSFRLSFTFHPFAISAVCDFVIFCAACYITLATLSFGSLGPLSCVIPPLNTIRSIVHTSPTVWQPELFNWNVLVFAILSDVVGILSHRPNVVNCSLSCCRSTLLHIFEALRECLNGIIYCVIVWVSSFRLNVRSFSVM